MFLFPLLIFLFTFAFGEESGLLGYWRFDEGRGNMVKDSSGNHLDGIIKGAKWVKGFLGYALEFDGRGSSVIIQSPKLDGMERMSVEVWILVKGEGKYSPLAKRDCIYRFIINEDGTSHFVVATEKNPWYSPGTVASFRGIPRYRWCHLAATYDKGKLRVYRDGELVAESSYLSGRIRSNPQPLVLGLSDGPNLEDFQGILDELRVYDRTLTTEEVKSHYYSALLARYLPNLSQGGETKMTCFDFSKSDFGWKGRETGRVESKSGALSIDVISADSAVVHDSLALETQGKDFIVLRMSTSKGKEGRVLLVTSEGSKILTFPLKSDGKPHDYCLRVSHLTEWKGILRALSLFPSDEKCTARIYRLCFLPAQKTPPQIKVNYFFSAIGVNRAGRPEKVLAYLTNLGGEKGKVRAKLVPCKGVKVLGEKVQELEKMEFGRTVELAWEVVAEKPMKADLKLVVSAPEAEEVTASYRMTFTPPLPPIKTSYIPEPKPVETDVLIGALNCPLWESVDLWKTVLRDLWRVPVLGFYDELNPEVKDWEIKWAVEHGIQFFVFCWYRVNQGKAPIQTIFERPITEGLFKSKFVSKMKFAIMWENQNRGVAGVSDENDLLNNLLPYWIDTFFKHQSYLKIDNKPLLFIYRPEYLVDDLGGVEKVRNALNKMREKCKEAGFDGLIILGEYRGLDPNHLRLMKDLGLDYAFAYCWPIPNNPPPDVAIKKQEEYWRKTEELGIMPQVITLSMGWTGWHDEGSIWKLPPKDFQTLCEKAREFIKRIPPSQLGSRLLLLDNWNEWGEGHYLMPHREYGFGYLDAVRAVFGKSPKEHLDLIPRDLGLGPYDHPEFRK